MSNTQLEEQMRCRNTVKINGLYASICLTNNYSIDRNLSHGVHSRVSKKEREDEKDEQMRCRNK